MFQKILFPVFPEFQELCALKHYFLPHKHSKVRCWLEKGKVIYKVTFIFQWFFSPMISEEMSLGMSAGNKLKYFGCCGFTYLLSVSCTLTFDQKPHKSWFVSSKPSLFLLYPEFDPSFSYCISLSPLSLLILLMIHVPLQLYFYWNRSHFKPVLSLLSIWPPNIYTGEEILLITNSGHV